MMTRGKRIVTVALALLTGGCVVQREGYKPVAFYDVPREGPLPLQAVGKLPRVINESSGLARGEQDGVYWTQNDSGDKARIFAIDAYGKLVGPAGEDGVQIEGAKNIDWEDLANDFRGNLLIAASGNNTNKRRDLAIYQIPMPDAMEATSVEATVRWPFHYPEQTHFPPGDNNFDCEALFVADGEIYLITKHRADSLATLYRLNDPSETTSNPLERIRRANLRGMVTGACSWDDGDRVAVLTYYGIWLFEPPKRDGARLFEGVVGWLPIRAHQVEAITFIDRDTLLLTNEQRDVFHVPVSDLHAVSLRE